MATAPRLSLERLAKAWLPLQSQHLMPLLVKKIGPEVARLAVTGAREGIKQGISPDGRPYKPLEHPRPGGGGGKPLNDTGAYAAAVSSMVTQEGLELKVSHPGANVHNFGGIIRAKRQFLTIPVTPEAKRAGRAKRFPRPLFFIPSKREATGLLCESDGRGGLRIHYVLKPSVKIAARPNIGFSPKTELAIVRYVGDTARDMVAASLQSGGDNATRGGSTPGITRGSS